MNDSTSLKTRTIWSLDQAQVEAAIGKFSGPTSCELKMSNYPGGSYPDFSSIELFVSLRLSWRNVPLEDLRFDDAGTSESIRPYFSKNVTDQALKLLTVLGNAGHFSAPFQDSVSIPRLATLEVWVEYPETGWHATLVEFPARHLESLMVDDVRHHQVELLRLATKVGSRQLWS